MSDRQEFGGSKRKSRNWDGERDDRPQRRSFDPTLVKVVGEAGRVQVDRQGRCHILIEYISYDNGPRQIQMRKVGTDRNTGEPFSTWNLGRLHAEQVEALMKVLEVASVDLSTERRSNY